MSRTTAEVQEIQGWLTDICDAFHEAQDGGNDGFQK